MTKIGGPGSRLYEMERHENKYDAKAPACFSKKPENMKPPRRCAHCTDIIPKMANHFQDVPNVGDLCQPCHVKWVENETDNDA